jgi:hypothetical protein
VPGQIHLFDIWTIVAMDRTSGQAEPDAQNFFKTSTSGICFE